ncbi:MAG: hypothetical protein E2598_08130 [Sphingobium sp.]|nr:hypothetical protein [Sphingobium sp.]
MYLAIQPQPDCVTAWLQAVRAVDKKKGHEAHNVIIDIADPTARADLSDPVVAQVDAFLRDKKEKPIETVANTIFPSSLYRRHGAPAFFNRFEKNVINRVRTNSHWSGYYFERMMSMPRTGQEPFNQIWNIVERLRNPDVKALNKFELSVFDPLRDVSNSPYGGQCLSFASLKLSKDGNGKKLGMTALYRNHFYIEKLLGNLIGLGRLLDFIAKEGGVACGSLTIISTHAEIDQPGKCTRDAILNLLKECDRVEMELTSVAT